MSLSEVYFTCCLRNASERKLQSPGLHRVLKLDQEKGSGLFSCETDIHCYVLTERKLLQVYNHLVLTDS